MFGDNDFRDDAEQTSILMQEPANIVMAQSFLDLEKAQLKDELHGLRDTLALTVWGWISVLATNQIAKLRDKINRLS